MSCYSQFLKWNALSFYFYSKNSFSKNIHYVIHLIFKNGINDIFYSQTSFLLVSSDTHAMPNRKTVESWGFNNLGYECNEYGEVTVIFCRTCREYYSTNAISSSSSTLIKSQVDKFVSGTNIVKKIFFFGSYKKDCFAFQRSYRFESDFGNTSGSNFYCYMCKRNEPKTERSIGNEISSCPFHSNTWKTF